MTASIEYNKVLMTDDKQNQEDQRKMTKEKPILHSKKEDVQES